MPGLVSNYVYNMSSVLAELEGLQLIFTVFPHLYAKFLVLCGCAGSSELREWYKVLRERA
jgi:hypothetical protein